MWVFLIVLAVVALVVVLVLRWLSRDGRSSSLTDPHHPRRPGSGAGLSG
ncbi:MAG: hypothetical protein HOQ22_11780 [Nocardioidaceae bacterium]|nr:hypothetical protein [Nocardioidaceae bacterium]NUS51703.1 hypothetical protein [Nocardioidaceae bacterium]